MAWTDDDPGAGDLGNLRHLAGRLDAATRELADVQWYVRSHTSTITDAAWAGVAADAWRQSGDTCVENLSRLVERLGLAGDALTTYAEQVDEIAEEAERERARRHAAGVELSMRQIQPRDMAPSARRRWDDARDDARSDVRIAGQRLEELADRRSAADRQVRAELDTVRVGDWDVAGRVVSRRPGGAVARPLGLPEGALASGQVAKDGWRLGAKSATYARYVRSVYAPVEGRPRATLRMQARAAGALKEFRFGRTGGGVLGKVVGSRAAGLVGKAFLPVTIVTGLVDVRTGGGYTGARGWATRGFGAAGAAGAAGVLLLSNPVGITVAGAAVLAYGAWSLGNLVWDNREAIGSFLTSARDRVVDVAGEVWDRTRDAAVDWAGNQLGKVSDAVSDFGKGALSVLSFGAL
ncbi:hypothetical protein [Cellulomonas sp. Marseille-Q8402]